MALLVLFAECEIFGKLIVSLPRARDTSTSRSNISAGAEGERTSRRNDTGENDDKICYGS